MTDMDRVFFEKTDFSFEVEGDDEEIGIRVYIDLESDRPRTLIASFLVDSMEMIESARIPLAAGCNHVPFQQIVRIVKPLLWQPVGFGTPSLYQFSVIFHQNGEPCYRIEKRAGIRFLETAPGDKVFQVNGRTSRLVGCEPDFEAPEASGKFVPKGNLVRLRDTDPVLARKLEYCGKQGLIVALELTGAAAPERFACLPEICLFTAESGSPGERRYQDGLTCGRPLAPLFRPEELNLLIGT